MMRLLPAYTGSYASLCFDYFGRKAGAFSIFGFAYDKSIYFYFAYFKNPDIA
jgi:hypothetical protein